MSDAQLRLSRRLQEIAADLEQTLGEAAGGRVGFILITIPERAGQLANYVSNCMRENGKAAMQELKTRWESQMEDVPLHRRQ